MITFLMILSSLQSQIYRTRELGDNFNLSVSGDSVSEMFPFELRGRSITHVVVSQDEDGTVVFGEVSKCGNPG